MLLENDPAAQAAVLEALARVSASRQNLPGTLPAEADPALVTESLAQLAGILVDEVDSLGGDGAGLLRRVYTAVIPARAREAGHG
jgi:hypothetical protein